MKYKSWLQRLLSFSCIFVCAQSAQAHPTLFSDYPLPEAKERAKTDHKLLLIDFTASWCGPCQRMDVTTWSDPLTEQWVKDNAIAIQLDVDRDKEIAAALKITAMPTFVVFTPNEYEKEFDREYGYKRTPELLAWLIGVKLGKSSGRAMESAAADAAGKGGSAEVQSRYKLADHLLRSGKYTEAADQFVWLWQNIPKEQPSMGGVRSSFMASEMKRLIGQFPDAKQRFDELREQAEKSENRSDWIVLNGILGERDKTLAWFDSVKGQPDQQNIFEHVDYMLEALLMHDNRWADIGTYLYKDPLKKLSKQHEFSVSLKEFYKKQHAEDSHSPVPYEYDPFPESAATIYAALLAAGREGDAEKTVIESFRLDDSRKLREALAKQAYRAHQVRPEQLQWLAEVPPSTVKDMPFYLNRADVYCQLQQYDLALNDYTQAIKKRPDDAELYSGRARILLQLKKFSDGLEDLNRSIQLDPKSAGVLVTRGYASYMLHHDEAAMADFNQAEQLDPKNVLIWIDKSAVFYRQKKYSEAYEAASRGIEIDPQNSSAFCNRGEAAFQLKHYQDALNDLNKAVDGAAAEDRAEAYYYRALVEDKLRKGDLAVQDRKMAAQLGGFTPEDPTSSPSQP